MDKCTFHDAGPGRQDRQVFEIVERAYNQHEKVVIYTQDQERAASLDRTLWIMKQEAFIPHKIFKGGETNTSVPVAIVTSESNPIEAGILIADGHCEMEYACGFNAVHEFVNRSSPEIQEACRDRFRAYRARQIAIEHLKE